MLQNTVFVSLLVSSLIWSPTIYASTVTTTDGTLGSTSSGTGTETSYESTTGETVTETSSEPTTGRTGTETSYESTSDGTVTETSSESTTGRTGTETSYESTSDGTGTEPTSESTSEKIGTAPTNETTGDVVSTTPSSPISVETAASTTPVSSTTQTPASTTTSKRRPISDTRPPNFDNVPCNLTFTLPFQREWNNTEYLNNTKSNMFEYLKSYVESTIKRAFGGCPGFKLCDVTKFEPYNETGTSLRDAKSYANDDAYTKASYNAVFDGEVVFTNPTAVFDYVVETVIPSLANETVSFGGNVFEVDYGVRTTMRDEMLNQKDSLISYHPCTAPLAAGKVAACEACYWCNRTASNTTDPNDLCVANCSSADNKYCQITDNSDPTKTWEFTCSCADGYLPVGVDCVSEDLIIGLSAGIGCALVVVLVALLIYFACRSSRDKKSPSLSEGETPMLTHDGDELGVRYVAAGDVTADVTDAGHKGAAAAAAGAPVVATATAAEPQASVPPYRVETTPDYDTAGGYYDISADPKYETFVPQLHTIDPYQKINIKRPSVILSTPDRTTVAYPNMAYNSDFFY